LHLQPRRVAWLKIKKRAGIFNKFRHNMPPMSDRFTLTWKGGSLSLHRCRVMGILNVTPDSFYDGGTFIDPSQAVERAWEMVDEGADLIDIGAESTRHGAPIISVEEERKRLFPVLEKLFLEKCPVPISLDTSKPEILTECYKNGWVQIANDITGLRNPAMILAVINYQMPVIIMHMLGTPQTMQDKFSYDDVVVDVIDFFKQRLNDCRLKENVVLDPGIGFGKGVQHNLALLNRLHEFQALGFPLLIGASRKSFIGKILELEAGERLEGSLAAAAIAVDRGASMLRVHDVKETVRVVKIAEAIKNSKSSTES
jgi:dihydropteroate synthase